jgi:glycerol-3-phosphate cytidylyltransferase-like family protein
LALETALTVTGVGNITKLRYLLKLRDLKKLTFTETVYLADGVATSLGVVNYMLEFSGTCGDDSPECKKIKEYLALVESSMSLGVANATLMKRKADEVLKALETNKGRLSISAEKRQKIIKHLREVANKQTVSLVENFRALERSGALKEVTLTIGDISLVLSNTSYLLKHAVCAENSTPVNQDDTLCKDIQEYLGYVQKAIKVKALVDKGVQLVAEKVYNRMNRHPNLFNTQQQRKAVLNELKKVVEAKPYHTNYSAQLKEDIATHPRIKQLFDNATNADRASLKAVWMALENRPHIRLGGSKTIKGENLEILAKVSPRFIYKGNSGVEGLKSFLAEGSKVERTQRYINNLQEANLLFDTSMPVTFSGVKKGDVIINDAAGKEIARYKGDVLQKKNIIEHPEQLGYTIVKQLEDFDMVRKGDEIGFKLK